MKEVFKVTLEECFDDEPSDRLRSDPRLVCAIDGDDAIAKAIKAVIGRKDEVEIDDKKITVTVVSAHTVAVEHYCTIDIE